jgi:hypothetical protein
MILALTPFQTCYKHFFDITQMEMFKGTSFIASEIGNDGK